MDSKKESNVLKECIGFIQQRKREIGIEESPYTEGDKEISYDIAEERTFPIPFCDVSRKLGFVDGGTASILIF